MEPEGDDLAIRYVRKHLNIIREVIEVCGLNTARLPRWIENARVEIGTYASSFLLLIEHSTYPHDTFHINNQANSLIGFFLEEESPARVPDYPLNGRIRQPEEFADRVLFDDVIFKLGDEWKPIFQINHDYHPPFIFHNLVVKHEGSGVPVTRYVPFAFVFHMSELSDLEQFLKQRTMDIVKVLKKIENSEFGDQHELDRNVEKAIRIRKEEGVVVLGSYDEPHLTELRRVRDRLNDEDYKANILIDFPNHPEMDWREKLRTWTSTARFCVLVDREASGANNEFEIIRTQETILAVLRPEGGGSTSMIPDSSQRLGGLIEIFHFDESPLEVIEDVINWSESMLE